MKRRKFRLESVLRFYELSKQRVEFELQKAYRTLHETDAEIAQLDAEFADVATLLKKELTTAAWIACYRKSDVLGRRLNQTRERRMREAEAAAKLDDIRRRLSIAHETLRFLEHDVNAYNQTQMDKAQQEVLDETVLKKWLEQNTEPSPKA